MESIKQLFFPVRRSTPTAHNKSISAKKSPKNKKFSKKLASCMSVKKLTTCRPS